MLDDNQLDVAIAATTATQLTDADIDGAIVSRQFHRLTDRLTVCVLTLRNGFAVTGESACAVSEAYDQGTGEWYAFQNARDKIWVLEGYLLRERLYQLKAAIAAIERV